MARFDLTDFEWSVIQPLVAEQAARRAAGGRPAGARTASSGGCGRVRRGPTFRSATGRTRPA